MWVLQRGHSGDGCDLASTLCKYDLRKGDLSVLSWAMVRQVRQGSLASELLMCGGGVRSIFYFCLYCDAWSCRCSCMGSVSVSSCRCCMFVSCVHPVAVLNDAFCMTCSVLMLVEDARGDHMEEAYSRAGLITANWSHLIHPGPASSRPRLLERLSHA